MGENVKDTIIEETDAIQASQQEEAPAAEEPAPQEVQEESVPQEEEPRCV